ncbi:uncharacterized protein [Epargyreus clarus]|uniref:uncharacterized protein n=1 Tax=Epargyreus clarus TaxID=520877 RepID=UPI003C2B9B78
MDFLGIVIVVAIAILEIQGKKLDPGPQDLNESAKLPSLSSQKRYATKEIILYLTPSQIKALQEGKAFISPKNHHVDGDKQAHSYVQPLPPHDHNEHLHQHLVPPQIRPWKNPQVAPVEEPQAENFNPIIPPPEYRHSDNYAYINFQPQHQQHSPKSALLFPEPNEQTLDGHKLPALNAHESLQEKSQENNFLRDHLKEKWYRLLDQNRAHLKALAALSQFHAEKSNENKKELLQYAPKYSDQKYALGLEHFINSQQLENQQALLQAEAIANSPPVVVHKEISIKHSPVHLIKQVKVPVPTPVLIPVPEPFEVKVPQPYPVPVEVIKPVPVPSVPLEVEKHIPFPVTKNVYINVDRPYFVDPREIPLHKGGLVPIHNHGWQH